MGQKYYYFCHTSNISYKIKQSFEAIVQTIFPNHNFILIPAEL